MEALLTTHDELERQGGLGRTISDVEAMIDLLKNAREAVATGAYLCGGLWTLLTICRRRKPSYDHGQTQESDEAVFR